MRDLSNLSAELLLKAITYGMITVSGMFIVIPIGVSVRTFDGFCILYSKAVWKKSKSSQPIANSNKSMCDFNIHYHIIVTILFAALMTTLYVWLFIRSCRGKKIKFLKALNVLNAIVGTTTFAVSFVSGCILAAGFNIWSSNLVEALLKDCSKNGADLGWNKSIAGSGFHTSFLIAIISCWISVFLWGSLGTSGIKTLFIGCRTSEPAVVASISAVAPSISSVPPSKIQEPAMDEYTDEDDIEDVSRTSRAQSPGGGNKTLSEVSTDQRSRKSARSGKTSKSRTSRTNEA